jgi:hypothetical protein
MRYQFQRPAALCAAGLAVVTGSAAALLAAAVTARPAWAQTGASAPMINGQLPAGSIVVNGAGEVQAKPDLARISLGVQTAGKKASDTARNNAQSTDALIHAVRAAGVAEEDVRTSDYSLDPQYADVMRRPNQPPTIVGYQANNTVTVTVRDISRVGAVIDAAVAAGGNVANGISFDLTDATREAAEDAALAKAVADARRKALAIARAAGAETLTLLAITEGDAQPRVVRPMVMMGRMDASGSAPTPVEAGQLSVTAQITAEFGSGGGPSIAVRGPS